MSQQASELVIRKSVTVSVPPEQAFRVFTEGIASWWPMHHHAVETDKAEAIVLEGEVGGRLYERTSEGVEHAWGVVTAWEPPDRVAFTWHPGRDEKTAQQIEVTFASEGTATRVELLHAGWERYGEKAAESMSQYDSGWATVLGSFAEAATDWRL